MFKEDFKYYKSRKPPPDLSKVLDFSNSYDSPEYKKITIDASIIIPTEFECTLISPSKWCAFELKSNPGLIFIKNPFTPIGQRYWISRCLEDYTKKPNKLNIDVHNYLSEGQDWWDYCKKLGDDSFMEQLRWATLGYHHNWDTKVYTEDYKSDFPPDLAKFCSFIANCLNFGEFSAEAAIVNFYHMNSTLSGHTDHSEENLEAPLFSFSFGQTAIFLIGGPSIEDKPNAIFLHSGDVVIMSKQSRLSYHGVPKIIPAVSNKPWTIASENYILDSTNKTLQMYLNNHLWEPFEKYVNKSRININIRQVNKNKSKN